MRAPELGFVPFVFFFALLVFLLIYQFSDLLILVIQASQAKIRAEEN